MSSKRDGRMSGHTEARAGGFTHTRRACITWPSHQTSTAGFTLIEMLVVIVVIAILAGLVGPLVFRNVGDAKVSAAKAQIEIFGLALDQYRLDNDYYPTTAQGLQALRALPTGDPPARNWRGPYLKKAVPMDPWGRPYAYTSPADSTGGYDLVSYGRDGRPGGTGEDADIR